MGKVRHRPTVIIDADRSGPSPNQRLLYGAIGAAVDWRPGTLSEAVGAQRRSDYPVIYHLHREDRIFDKIPASENRRSSVQSLLDDLSDFAAAGGRFVWTRRILTPRDESAARIHAELVPHLSAAADVIHVHSWGALEALAAAGQASIEKTVIIGQGNCLGQYAERPAPAARAQLKIDEGTFVLLFFEPDRSVTDAAPAIEAFSEIDAGQALLFVVGQASGGGLSGKGNHRVKFVTDGVEDDDIGLYFAAANAVLLGSGSSLSSDKALLTAGLGRGAIGPDFPGIADIYDDGKDALLYPPQDAFGLVRSMRIALNEGVDVWATRGETARRKVRCRDWSVAARMWIALYRSLSATPRPGTMERGAVIEVAGL